MAVNFKAPEQEQPKPDYTNAGTQSNSARPAGSGFFGNSNTMRFGVIAKGSGSEFVGRVRNGIVKYMSDLNDSISASVITLEGEELAYNTILICFVDKTNPGTVAYHALLLEATGKKPEPLTINEGGIVISHPRTPSDAFDIEMYKIIEAKMRREFPSHNIINAGGSVVYADQELFYKNQDGEYNVSEKFRNVLFKASNLISTEMHIVAHPDEDINLADIIRNDANSNVRTSLVINVTQERQSIETDTGNVVRSDVNVSFRSKRVSTTSYNSLNGGQQVEEFGRVNGFVDLINLGSQNGFFMNPNDIPTQRYGARFIITGIESNIAFTPAAILLMATTISPIRYENNWVTLLRSKNTNRKEIDFTDIGALGIENNLTPNIPDTGFKHIDTKSESVTAQDFAVLTSRLLHKDLVISMDVMDHDIDSCYLDVFSIANDNPSNNKAREIIYRSANILTGGHFSKYMPSSDGIFTDHENRIHMGYFTRNGKRHDVREIDYIAVANYASATKDPSILTRWAQTFNDKSKPLYTRLAERLAIIKEVSGDSFVLTGYASRVTFTGRFTDALLNAINATGMVTDTTIPTTANSMTDGVTQASFFGEAIGNPNFAFLRNNGAGLVNSRHANVGYQPTMPDRFI